MRWPLPLLLMVLTGCSGGPSKEAIALRKQLAREADGIRTVTAKAKITTTSADGQTTVSFHADCYFIRGGILRIVPLEFGIGVFDAIAVDTGIMTQVVGEETAGKLTDLAYDTVDPLAWWVPMPVELVKTGEIKMQSAGDAQPGGISFKSGDAEAYYAFYGPLLVSLTREQPGTFTKGRQNIGLDKPVRVRNEAAASYKPDVPEFYMYPSLINIRTEKVTATLDLSEIRINAPIPAGTLPKAFEDLAK